MKNKSALALRRRAETYTVLSNRLELPRGARFIVTPGPVQAGQLALVSIGGKWTVGRWLQDIAGCDLIVQPGLLVVASGRAPVRVVGPITLLR